MKPRSERKLSIDSLRYTIAALLALLSLNVVLNVYFLHHSCMFQSLESLVQNTGGWTLQQKQSLPQPQQKSQPLSPPPQCSREDLLKIRSQLPPDDCAKPPYRQQCSLTVATKCPEATWLDEYYTEITTKTMPQAPTITGLPFCRSSSVATRALMQWIHYEWEPLMPR